MNVTDATFILGIKIGVFSLHRNEKDNLLQVLERIYNTKTTSNLTFETFLQTRPVHQKPFYELCHLTATYTVFLRRTQPHTVTNDD
jgi:hypothetical protein